VDPRGDQALVEALGAGDGGALTELYERHGAVVYRMALRVLGRAGRLRLTGQLSSYLYPVVTRLARRARERAGRRVDDGEVFLSAALALVAPGARHEGEGADRAELARALALLPAAQREALLLRYADGLSVEEAATALGCPEGTVRSRVHHALRSLRAVPGLAERLGL
jgi:RNA polymerase sigma-70 factor (ECF subfamily)